MTAQDFFDTYNGKGIDFDQAYGYQCMDLAEQYNRDVVGAPRLGGNAVDVWEGYPHDSYDRVPNTPTGVPQLGDILIWGTDIGQYGHIAVFKEGDTSIFTSFDQNWPIGSLCHYQAHGYNGLLGWLHPKAAAAPATDPLTECLRQHTQLVQACNDKDAQIAKQNQLIDSLNQQVPTLQSQITSLGDQLQASQHSIESLKPLAAQVPDLQAQLSQAQNDRRLAMDAQENMNRSIAQYRNSSFKGTPTATLVNELLTRAVNRVTKRR